MLSLSFLFPQLQYLRVVAELQIGCDHLTTAGAINTSCWRGFGVTTTFQEVLKHLVRSIAEKGPGKKRFVAIRNQYEHETYQGPDVAVQKGLDVDDILAQANEMVKIERGNAISAASLQ